MEVTGREGRESSTMGDRSGSKETQLELPLGVSDRLPPRAAERHNATRNVENARRAAAALRAATVQREQKVNEARKAVMAIRRTQARQGQS